MLLFAAEIPNTFLTANLPLNSNDGAPRTPRPSDTAGDFELPSDNNEANENPEEVSWNATPQENEGKTIEKRKSPVCHQVSPHLSSKKALKKDACDVFQAMDKPAVLTTQSDQEGLATHFEDFLC